jgi:hypothetical protein
MAASPGSKQPCMAERLRTPCPVHPHHCKTRLQRNLRWRATNRLNFDDASDEELRQAYDQIVMGNVYLPRALLPDMVANSRGRLIYTHPEVAQRT